VEVTVTGRASSVLRSMQPDVFEATRRRLIAEEDERWLVYYCKMSARLAVQQLFERGALNAQLVSARMPEHRRP
jgi:hypothetical protein